MAEETKPAHHAAPPRSVIIRARPKVVFLYPTLLAAILAGVWTAFALQATNGDLDAVALTPGRIFWWTFAINLAAMAFDFTRGEFIALVLFFGVLLLSIVLLEQKFEFVKPVQTVLSQVKLVAHPHLYFMISAALAATFAFVFVNGRFDCWELTSNELIHHHGMLGNVERYPAPNLRMTKEVTDVFEYALLRSGRLVLHAQGAPRAIVLENVIGVDTIEAEIQRMLSTLSVTVDGAMPRDPGAV
jgi:hypothetical protein